MRYSSSLRFQAGLLGVFLFGMLGSVNAEPSPDWQAFFEKEVTDLEGRFAKEVQTKADWETKRGQYRQELKEMLGLDPEPARSELKPVATGQLEAPGIVVEKLHFQATPGLYVTANFYRPAEVTRKLPTILYLCGHGGMIGKDGRSNGNKAHYQHHGIWFAQHGYTCLVIDTVQWGEFLGEHWGTYRLNRWWWLARGYTPAGLEAWSGIRALDYLATRPEVDMEKIGCTGRSGGGAYTWYVTALDDRVKVACPTAGITTLRDHVLGNCIEGHCDCMFMNNFHRWDFDKLAALSAPRPLLISNTDKDNIFPLGGVMRIYNSTRRLYALLDKEKSLGLQLAEGPHQDTQPLNMGAFHWFDRFLKGTDPMAVIKEPAVALFDSDQLRVFKDLPKDEINTRIDESFVPAFKAPPVPETREQWESLKTQWLAALQKKVFTKWNPTAIPSDPADSHPSKAAGASVEGDVRRPAPRNADPARPDVGLVTSPAKYLSANNHHFLRRCALLGLPFDQLQTVRPNRPHAVAGVAAVEGIYDVILHGSKAQMSLVELPTSHRQGPFYFNILRYMDIPQAVAMAAETCHIVITGRAEDWAWATQTAEKMGFGKNLTIVPEMELLSVQKLWDASGHQAFTDIIRFKDEWFCVFREGSSHVPGTNGTIRILTSKDAEHWESAAVLTENGIDLRDPKICLMPDGKLMLSLGGSIYDSQEGGGEKRKLTGARSRVSFSTDGRTWTAPQPVSKDGDWLWRVTPEGKSAYGMSYTHTAADQNFKLHLWKTTDGLTYENIGNPELGRQCWPNETTLRFLPDHTMQALVRNEHKGGHTFYGTAAPPYKTWSWTDTGEIIQGPNFLRLSDGRTIYAGRDFVSGKTNTTVGRLSPDGYATPLLVLPSGGDTSYPGLAEAPDGRLLVSYYSSHEGKTAVYLAKVRLR